MSAPPSSAPPADRAHRPRRRPGPGRDRRQRPRHPRGGRPQILEPFYTTKPVGQGAGLGLDICWRIVVRRHGDLRFTSAAGDTRFQVLLPSPRTG
jgi:hypothetical protein